MRIAPTVAPFTVAGLDQIADHTLESRGHIIDRLVALELKRMARRTP